MAREIKNIGASVRARLLKFSKEHGQSFDLVLTRFALERLLYRLSTSPHADRFVLKGAMLMMSWFDDPHRGTRDLDLLGFGDSPNRIVRDTVRGVLEAEVGAVTGGRRFDAIRANIEAAYSALRTSAAAKSRGDLAAAEARVSSATTARQEAESCFREYEHALSELDAAKSRLRLLERDLVDPEAAEQRRKLEADQKVAETAALRLSAAEAQFGRAEEIAKTVLSRIERLNAAEARAHSASKDVKEKEHLRDEAKAGAVGAGEEEKSLRVALEIARKEREKHEATLSGARARLSAFARAAGARRAIDARKALAGLEERERELINDCAHSIDNNDLEQIAVLERAAIQARARFESGAVKVEIELREGAFLTIDGELADVSSVDVLKITRFELGNAGSLVVRPPQGSGQSLEADLTAATEELASAQRSLGVTSYAEGLALNERAAAVERELKSLRVQMASACPGDPTIGLAAGADALRAFVAGLGDIADIDAPAARGEDAQAEAWQLTVPDDIVPVPRLCGVDGSLCDLHHRLGPCRTRISRKHHVSTWEQIPGLSRDRVFGASIQKVDVKQWFIVL